MEEFDEEVDFNNYASNDTHTEINDNNDYDFLPTENNNLKTSDNLENNIDEYDFLNDEQDLLNGSNDELLNSILRQKGIDPDSVKFAGEDGEPLSYKFNELNKEEKLYILSQEEKSPIDEDELNTINFFRQNNISLQDYTKYIQEEAVKNYSNHIENKDISIIEDASDEDIYTVFLQDRFPDMTEEEIVTQIENDKLDETVFAKKVNAIRNDMISYEQENIQNEQKEKELEQQNKLNSLYNNLNYAANNITEIGNIILDDNDANEIMSYILEKDFTGKSEFDKDLESPEKLYKLAWFAKFGEQAFDMIHREYQRRK